MAPKRKRRPAVERPIERHPLERFDAVPMLRSELKSAAYNPRVITDTARAALKRGLKKLGLLSPVTWNKRSGCLVGGHQRLKLLDGLAGGAADYKLTVAQVDLSDTEEREANVLLNNPEAMGGWDVAALEKLVATPDFDVGATGFDEGTLLRTLGFDPRKLSDERLEQMSNEYRRMRDLYQAYRYGRGRRSKDQADQDYYLVIVFRDAATRDDFTDGLGLDRNRYQDGRLLLEMIRKSGDGFNRALAGAVATALGEAIVASETEDYDPVERAIDVLESSHPQWRGLLSAQLGQRVGLALAAEEEGAEVDGSAS